MKVRNRETGEILDAEILTEEWSRSIVTPHGQARGVTRGKPGDYRLTDERGEKWGIRDIHLPLLFEVAN
jgi:hypothetical protein